MRAESKLIYLGAPYSDPDPTIIAARMAAFEDVVARLLTEGQFPISPLLNHGLVGRHKVGGDWTFWQHYSRRLLTHCDVLMIIELPGWQTSEGVTGEIDLARMLSIPVEPASWSREVYDKALAFHRQKN